MNREREREYALRDEISARNRVARSWKSIKREAKRLAALEPGAEREPTIEERVERLESLIGEKL